MKSKVILSVLPLFFSLFAAAQTYTIVSNGTGGGDWSDASSWNPNREPVCGDIIHILSGDNVEIDGQQNYSEAFCPGDYMFLLIDGTLEFSSNGPKLRFPCNGSAIEVGDDGLVTRTGGGGGQANYIDICDNIVWTGTDPDIDEPIILTGPLPIELLSFEVAQLAQSCKINWVTATEVNNDFFTIERSRDANFWEVIATVEGSGNSSQLIEYNYIDYRPWTGASYYRLRQTDFNGSFETFNPRSFYLGQEEEITLFPNPADQEISLEGTSIDEVRFRDSIGRLHIIPFTRQDEDRLLLDVSGLPDGVYQLELTKENGEQKGETLYIIH